MDELGVSFTEKEYAYAVENLRIVVLAFLHGDLGSIPVAKSDTDPALLDRLNAFRATVSKGRLVQFWKTREDLKAKIIIALSKAMSENPGIGWIRGTLSQVRTCFNRSIRSGNVMMRSLRRTKHCSLGMSRA